MASDSTITPRKTCSSREPKTAGSMATFSSRSGYGSSGDHAVGSITEYRPPMSAVNVRPTPGMPSRSQTCCQGWSTASGRCSSAHESPGLARRHSHEYAAASVERVTSAATSAADGMVASSAEMVAISDTRSLMARCATSDGSCLEVSIHVAPEVRRNASMLAPAIGGSMNPCSMVSQPSRQPVDGPLPSARLISSRAGQTRPGCWLSCTFSNGGSKSASVAPAAPA